MPKSRRELFVGERLAVYWLALPGDALPARKEYAKVEDAKVQAALAMIDRLLVNCEPVPASRMEKITIRGVSIWEIKAPQRAKRIYRLLCYQHANWDLYVAFVGEKRDRGLRDSWLEGAVDRIKRSLAAGGP